MTCSVIMMLVATYALICVTTMLYVPCTHASAVCATGPIVACITCCVPGDQDAGEGASQAVHATPIRPLQDHNAEW